MTLYAAIDLHSNNGVLSVIDEQDHVVFERRLRKQLGAGAASACTLPRGAEGAGGGVDLQLVLAGRRFVGCWRGCSAGEHCGDPQYAGLKHGNDHTDARHLAHLLRLNLLPEGYIYPREQRGVRDLLRRRFQLVRQSVTLTNSLQSAWSRRTGHGIRTNELRLVTAEAIETTFVDVHERLAVLSELKLLQCLHTQVDQMERWVLESIRSTPELQALRSTPGIGVILGSTILLETGEITRFDSVGDYASYCRMVESTRLSNGKKKGSGNAKCGNR